MKKIAVFPGSFDPFTIGHESIVRRALPLFDEIVIAVGYNAEKNGYFSLEKRMSWIRNTFSSEKNISVASYDGLTVDFCKSVNAAYILRGLRSAFDFEYERLVAQMNQSLYDKIETIFILTKPELASVNSSTIRDIIRHGGDASAYVPKAVTLK